MDYYYYFVKKEDGDIYIKCRTNQTIYKYGIGGMKLYADNIYMGDLDVSK